MAIRWMTDEEHAMERIDNYSGHVAGVIRHDHNCASRTDPVFCTCTPWTVKPLYMRTDYVGAVLATGEMNGYDDSDFYAIVWDEAEGRVKRITYGTTRFWTYPNNAHVDATPEVMEKAARYLAKGLLAQAVGEAKAIARRVLTASPSLGEDAVVFKGRKVKKGTVGRVFWSGHGNYGPRIGLELLNGDKVYTATTNVKGLDLFTRRRAAGSAVRGTALAQAGSRAALLERLVKNIISNHSWRAATSVPGWAVL